MNIHITIANYIWWPANTITNTNITKYIYSHINYAYTHTHTHTHMHTHQHTPHTPICLTQDPSYRTPTHRTPTPYPLEKGSQGPKNINYLAKRNISLCRPLQTLVQSVILEHLEHLERRSSHVQGLYWYKTRYKNFFPREAGSSAKKNFEPSSTSTSQRRRPLPAGVVAFSRII